MAVLAVATSSPPGIEGGHLIVARALVAAARESGHDARLVITPDFGFGRLSSSYWNTWWMDVRRLGGTPVDQVISLRYPSFALRHPAHVCWLNHTMREYYDLWPHFAKSISIKNRVKESVRKTLLHAADRWLLRQNVTRVVAQSRTIQRRLDEAFNLRADVLLPPPPPRAYRCDAYGDYIFAPSRLTPLKRVELLVRPLAEPAARGVRAVVAGDGEERANLEALAAALGVADRVTFAGWTDDAAMVDHLARCRAVCFTPYAEDYGLVTAEAFASGKAVITCRDSGGPVELVRHEETGLVCDATPRSLADALARIIADRALAERLGAAAAARAATMTWADAVSRLLIV